MQPKVVSNLPTWYMEDKGIPQNNQKSAQLVSCFVAENLGALNWPKTTGVVALAAADANDQCLLRSPRKTEQRAGTHPVNRVENRVQHGVEKRL